MMHDEMGKKQFANCVRCSTGIVVAQVSHQATHHFLPSWPSVKSLQVSALARAMLGCLRDGADALKWPNKA